MFSFKLISPPLHTEAIVALTGGEYRVQTAIDLLTQDKADRLLITGVNQKISPASVLAKAPEEIKRRITLGYQATTTEENALETKGWIEHHHFKTILLVTSFYHMPRAYLEISAQLPNTDISFYPIWPRQFDQSVNWIYTRSAWQLLLEYHKFLYVWITQFLERLTT
ncbi:MAG: YdcF family protein [Alphaproteobacteria bacterium]|nr:YdcF family protein [Alphaproteobacteria bacterium]